MRDDIREIIDLVLECGRFHHIFIEDDLVFVAHEIGQLTGVCAPSVRAIMGTTRVDYDLLLVVVSDLSDPIQNLKDTIAAYRFVGLPKVVSTSHSLDMLVNDERISDWLVSEMLSDMHRYTLGRESALELIKNDDDKFIQNLKSVFKDKFRQHIEEPLAKLA